MSHVWYVAVSVCVRRAQGTGDNDEWNATGRHAEYLERRKKPPIKYLKLFAFHRIVMHQIAHTNQSRSKKTDT